MTRGGRFFSRRAAVMSSAAVLALLAGTLAAPAHAALPDPTVTAVECPTAVPLSQIQPGLQGEALTVVSGTEPSPINVEVIGVLKNGIGAGKDIIMVTLSDVPGSNIIEQSGGGWSGISGSPVYVGDQLLGSLSFGFTSSPSPIMGLTPAAYMTPLLGLAGTAAARTPQPAPKKSALKLSGAARARLAAEAGTAAPRGSLQPMPTPLGVSGVASRRIDRLQSQLEHAGRPYRVYAAGGGTGAAVGTTPTVRPQGGGNFAFSLATGDVDAWGVGATTFVCGNQAVAFGHPIDLAGPVSYAANDADTVAIIKDDVFGPFKLANLGASIGTLDQDRTTGVRADLTRTPDTTTVVTNIDNGDTGASRTGTTQVSDTKSLSGLLPYIVFAGQDAVFDEWGDGVATSDWTISGTRAGGVPFSVSRANSWASQDDVTIDPAVDVARAVDQLLTNDYENVTIDNVTFSSTMKTKYHQRHITSMSVSVNGKKYSSAKRLNLKVGDKLKVKVGLKEYRGVGTKYTTLALTVPKKARGQVGSLSAIGGVDLAGFEDFDEDCLFLDECDSSASSSSLTKIISSIRSAPRNNSVVAQLSYDTEDDDTVTAAKATKLNTLTVTGSKDILVRIR